ncbi:MAG: calcium-binding protein [Acidimicrobiales bacterium]
MRVETSADAVELRTCGFPVDLAPRADVTITCGSINVVVTTGQATVDLGGGTTLVVPAGVTATAEIRADGEASVTATGGNVTLNTPTGPVVLNPGPARLLCQGRVPTHTGTNGPNLIIGTNGPDVIYAGGGTDVIVSLGGDDIICAGTGDDIITAGNGNDRVEAGDGNDASDGGAGTDILNGSNGNDILTGGADTDILDGGSGTDRCITNPGNDTRTSCER